MILQKRPTLNLETKVLAMFVIPLWFILMLKKKYIYICKLGIWCDTEQDLAVIPKETQSIPD